MSRLLAIAILMHAAPAAGRRVQHGAPPVVYFEGHAEDALVTVARQGSVVHEGQGPNYTFTSDQLHKEYVVETTAAGAGPPCAEPVFVQGGSGGLCGTGLFTARELTCASVPTGAVEAEAAELAGLEPPSDRGVGLEFEFIARDDQRIPNLFKIMELKGCFANATSGARASCERNSQCALADYCRSDGVCDSRLNCRSASRAREGACPASLAHWEWKGEPTTHALSQAEAALLGAGAGETRGIPFEVTSPGPPHVLSGRAGFRSAYEMLALLRRVGIQAGPSQGMHVHVNVMNAKVPGALLSPAQVAAVWAAYAKYQLVIDEMLSPGRHGSKFARRLFLGNCPPKAAGGACNEDACACARRIFNQMHQWLRRGRGGTPLEFCNAANAMPDAPTPCEREEVLPHQRDFQLNLTPLHRFGTIEFRAHSATYDPVRVARWVQFLVAFVDYHGRGPGFGKLRTFFEGDSPDAGYHALQEAQREATAVELFGELEGLVHAGTARYFESRAWERGDPACRPSEQVPTTESSSCFEADDEKEHWWDEERWMPHLYASYWD